MSLGPCTPNIGEGGGRGNTENARPDNCKHYDFHFHLRYPCRLCLSKEKKACEHTPTQGSGLVHMWVPSPANIHVWTICTAIVLLFVVCMTWTLCENCKWEHTGNTTFRLETMHPLAQCITYTHICRLPGMSNSTGVPSATHRIHGTLHLKYKLHELRVQTANGDTHK